MAAKKDAETVACNEDVWWPRPPEYDIDRGDIEGDDWDYQLADDSRHEGPQARTFVGTSFKDDIVFGHSSIAVALKLEEMSQVHGPGHHHRETGRNYTILKHPSIFELRFYNGKTDDIKGPEAHESERADESTFGWTDDEDAATRVIWKSEEATKPTVLKATAIASGMSKGRCSRNSR
ncbi:uncharacterized protein PAC_20126 [Phialocephala subalpina]|uniref:Uncharacterized protein n=1 Tax=Phialocephala subalpina TaxID=576137 RepID=A0A1L7XZ41_9HELO|nr:uncharacterized protein PAC_20126 [Phialocephala subalpina]